MKDVLAKGYGMPTVTAHFNGAQVDGEIGNFKYVYSEEEPDDCNFDIKGLTINHPDTPAFQERAKWVISWGYIGHPKKTRVIFINDLDWSYDDEKVTCSIQGSDKAITLKQSSSNKIHKNVNLIDLAKNMADKHDLSCSLGVEVSDSTNKAAGTLTEAEKKGKNFIEIIVASERKRKEATKTIYFPIGTAKTMSEGLKRQQESLDKLRKTPLGVMLPTEEQLKLDNGRGIYREQLDFVRTSIANLRRARDIPQGNKSDMQLLKEEAMKEQDQFMIDTRDGGMVIRKRNFGQAPYKSYYYRREPGEVLSFKPLTSNKSRKGSSVNQNYSGWDKDNKRFFTGDANPINDKTQITLNKYQEELTALNKLPDDAIIGVESNKKVFATATGNTATGGTDNTSTQMFIKAPITVIDRKNALQAVLDQFNQSGHNKGFHDPTANNPDDAFNHASNDRTNSELKKNHGTIKLLGDQDLESGKIITVLGVSKKHSGNYYITKCSHDISGDYTVVCEIIRNGHNLKSKPNFTATKKTINNIIGPTKKQAAPTTLPIISNIR